VVADQNLDRHQAEEVTNRRVEEGKELERCFHTPKSEWGEGPWQDEPDELWMQAQGYDCALIRNEAGGWCGYVFLGQEHPWAKSADEGVDSQVHGGVTFSGPIDECFFFKKVAGANWVVGFDMGHAFDLLPAHEAFMKNLLGRPSGLATMSTYRTMEDAKSQLIVLATEAAEAATQMFSDAK
jgi:hypothetical protein